MFERILAALNRAGVRYVVVGGVAVVLHGHARLTADLDLVVDLAPAAAHAAVEALLALGFRPRLPVAAADFAVPEVRQRWMREKGLQVFTFWDPANPMAIVDFFVEYPIPFAELLEGAEVRDVAGTPVRIASIPDLLAMKRAAGRPRDLEDIRALEEIAARRGGHDADQA